MACRRLKLGALLCRTKALSFPNNKAAASVLIPAFEADYSDTSHRYKVLSVSFVNPAHSYSPFFDPLQYFIQSAGYVKEAYEQRTIENSSLQASDSGEGSDNEDEKNAAESRSGWTAEEVISWPNAISMSRLFSGPLLAWYFIASFAFVFVLACARVSQEGLPSLVFLVMGFTKAAFCGMVVAGVSDWLDGYVARKMHMKSVLGSYLDPFADKVLVGSVALSMAYSGLLQPSVVAVVVARDVALVFGALFFRAYSLNWQWGGWREFFKINAGGAEKMKPILISKVNTVLQILLICAALLQPAIFGVDVQPLVHLLSWLVISTTVGSWFCYTMIFIQQKL